MNKQTEKPFWVHIEEEIQHIGDTDFASDRTEATVHKIAAILDDKDLNVSRTAGKLLQLRFALEARVAAGHALMGDLDKALADLTVDSVANTHVAAVKIVRQLNATWPILTEAAHIQDVKEMVENKRLALLTNVAKKKSIKDGIRYLREEKIATNEILKGLDIDQAKLDAVEAELAAELVELQRVRDLFEAVSDKEMNDRIKHLLSHDAKDQVIVQVAGISQDAVDAAKESMKRELEEKQRLAEEEAARKAAEAAGPAIDDIPADQMIEYIEGIREILEFSNAEEDIRTMCEQSSIPKALVDIAVSEPDKLDQLEAQAEA